MIFSFCYLFFLQGEILVEAQFVYSKGVTSYDVLIGAIVITVVLQVIQWIVALLSHLPSRWHALSYLPSMLMLAMLTDVNRGTIEHFSFGGWTWGAPILLLIYIFLVIIVRRVDANTSVYMSGIKSQIYPNFIILFFLMLGTGAIPQSTDVYHYELKAERLILAKDYKGAAAVGKISLRTSARLTQLRMYALSKQGLLPECIFDYPQYYGSDGLLNIADTSSLERFTSRDICFHLGAFPGKTVRNAARYYKIVLGDSIYNQHTVDYYLCSLLLDKNLKEFCRQLPSYYNLSDSCVGAYDSLPRAYREALLQQGERSFALQGEIVIGTDTLATLSDNEMVGRFRDYNELKNSLKDTTERINRTHREYGNTYWWYYDYSHLATGELEKKSERYY